MTTDAKKRGLGRGLDALFQDVRREEESFQPKVKRADELVQSRALDQPSQPAAPVTGLQGAFAKKLPVDRLTPGKFQPRHRFDDSALDQLSESIAQHGVLQPLLVRPISGSMYEIIAGERRWRAAQRAQVHEVPVIIRDLTDLETLEIALIENLQREDLTALEEAEGYQRLIDEFGHTQEALAQHLGKSRSHVANTLRLLKLPLAVKSLIQTGVLSAGHARTLVGAKNPEEIAGVIVKRGLSVRQAEQLVKKAEEGKLKKPKTRSFVQKDVDILALEEKITAQLGLKVTIEGQGSAGKLIIAYKTLEQLDDVIGRLSALPQKNAQR